MIKKHDKITERKSPQLIAKIDAKRKKKKRKKKKKDGQTSFFEHPLFDFTPGTSDIELKSSKYKLLF